MLVIKIELWPRGDEKEKKLLHVGWIGNVGTGTRTSGNYKYVLSQRNTPGRTLRKGFINGFPRKRLSAWDLLYRCLREAVGDRNNNENNLEV